MTHCGCEDMQDRQEGFVLSKGLKNILDVKAWITVCTALLSAAASRNTCSHGTVKWDRSASPTCAHPGGHQCWTVCSQGLHCEAKLPAGG